MSRRNPAPAAEERVNGWTLTKRPNSFAEDHVWNLKAIDAEGYLVEEHGFMSKRDATRFATYQAAPIVKAGKNPLRLVHCGIGTQPMR